MSPRGSPGGCLTGSPVSSSRHIRIRRGWRSSRREREVLLLVAQGLTNVEIAGRLTISEATVKAHVGRILTKLDLRDRVQIVVTAYETGLVKPGT